ncbi:Serine/threonine-protein kinase, active site [Sesbania bispinosa]|nr:Serine/threonine-protein kinase, active site [Sesbania bispinosa]
MGNLLVKDFDIQKEAGGFSYRAVQKQFRIEVKENYLEIHLFWAGKGVAAYQLKIPYLRSVTTPQAVKIIKLRRKHNDDDEELLGIDTKPYTFGYSELRNATNDFNLDNKLGEGGFGLVYKDLALPLLACSSIVLSKVGTLNDGRVVAVKQLSVGSHQGKSQFIAEIATISVVQHRNLVKLYGCCIEGSKRLLVYEYLENKSLDKAYLEMFYFSIGPHAMIYAWVLQGVLTYLHEESRLRIVHRDVKASNILLDYNLVPKISDFGLAKLYDEKMTHISTRVAGTIGYLAPEFAMRGRLTEKADVFSFGVVALELVSGRANSGSSLEGEKTFLLEWPLGPSPDPRLSEFKEEEVKRIVGIALLCTQASPTLRPSMSRVVAMLSGDCEVSTVTSRPGYLTDFIFDDLTSMMSDITIRGSDSSNYNSSASTNIVGGADHSPISPSKPSFIRLWACIGKNSVA